MPRKAKSDPKRKSKPPVKGTQASADGSVQRPSDSNSFARYHSAEFTAELTEHLHRAKKAALTDRE